MRNTSYWRGSYNESAIPWKWISIVCWIIAILVIVRIFWSSDTNTGENYLTVTPWSDSSVYISMTSASKNRITSEEKLFASDKSVSVELWNAIAKNESLSIDLDKWTELEYKSSSKSGNTIALPKWRAWIQDITTPLKVEMKNYTINVPVWSILLIEQNWPYSNTYVLWGKVTVETQIGNIDITSWNTLSLLKSDLVNPSTNLWDWIRPIGWSILEYPLLMRNDWAALLGANSINQSSSGTINDTTDAKGTSWSTLSSWTNTYIEITEPKAWILSKANTVSVMGNILSPDVKRVTINNVEAVVSPVNETFVLQNISITREIFDIVYKAYGSDGSILQTWVLTIFWDKNTVNTNSSLVPETFPIWTKEFKITFPTENPYSTIERFIKVQWVVPKNTVDYIVVNDYRLQKFIPNSWSWYYFANMETGTMKEWLNLYNIKFYKQDGTLLYTQPFTIIKESKNATVSGE